MRIDHVIYATRDLDATAARLEAEHGLVAKGGGRHTGIGTENRIFPLGGGYLELIAVADYAEAERSALGHELARRIRERGEGLMGWVVAVDDVVAEAARTGAELSTIERDGLRARLAGVATAMTEATLPFFIERDEGIADPGEGGDAGGITWVEVAGDAQRLRGWLGDDADLPVRVREGAPAVLAVGVGERALR
jgi:glyoxalase-like protein